jgi:O-antigen/teichoic acid export membrane protein
VIKNKILKNASWIIICKIAQSVLSFIVTMLTARYLGPSNYGLVNYVASIVAFVAPIAQLGLGNIQVQEIVNSPDEEGKIVGTTIGLSLGSGFFCIIGVISFALIANANETNTIVVCMLYSIILLFQGAELLQYWFQAKYLSKYASIVSLIAFAIVTLYRIMLLIKGLSIYWFAVANAIDYMLIMVVLVFLYKKLGGKKLSFSISVAKRILSKSKHYIVANMMVAIFSQTDRVMLKLLLDESATGIYSAAISCASLANFLYLAIIDSFRPKIFEDYKLSKKTFEKSMSLLYAVVIYMSLFQCILVTLLSKYIIGTIYGAAYGGAVPALQIAVWYSTFSFIGSIRNIWILAEGQQKWLWLINLSGALANVILNFVLIPIYGVIGAAIASLLTQFMANVVVSYLIPGTRRNTFIMIKGLNISILVDCIRNLRNRG